MAAIKNIDWSENSEESLTHDDCRIVPGLLEMWKWMTKSKEKATYDLLCQWDVGEPDGKEEKMNQLKFTISLKPLWDTVY